MVQPGEDGLIKGRVIKRCLHVDENDSQRPNVRWSRLVSGCKVVTALKTHVGSAATVHISAVLVRRRESKIHQLDDDTSLAVHDSVGDDEILWFYVPVKDTLFVTRCHGITHLREHACDETQPI